MSLSTPTRHLWSGAWCVLALLVVSLLPNLGNAGQKRLVVEFESIKVRAEEPDKPMVIVRGLGPIAPARLEHACKSLVETYPVLCKIGKRRGVFDFTDAWNGNRMQLDARKALDLMFRDRTHRAVIELNLTELDIFEVGKPFVFGLASLTDRVAIVSLKRIGKPAERLERRLHKLVLHEVGHAIGLPHDANRSCVMRQDATPASLDSAPYGLCDVCRADLHNRAQILARPGQVALDRTLGHLVRGESKLARVSFLRWARSGSQSDDFDVRLLSVFARVFMENDHLNEAIAVLRLAVDRSPSFAQAHVDLARVYERRGRVGDNPKAILHYQQALDLQPGWIQVETRLGKLQDQVARAQGPE